MSDEAMLYAQIISNIIAIIMVIVSWRWKSWGRFLFVALFLWAGQYNFRTALLHPEEYINYAPLAYLEMYRTFILGFFADHVAEIVGTIALAQIIIGVLISLHGSLVTLGLIGAIIFLTAIAPLGTGAGFPATLIMAIAAFLLLRKSYEQTLFGHFFTYFKKPA